MEIVKNISTIGYVLFHCRKTEGQHLFAVRGTCNVVSVEAVTPDRYKNVSTTDFYLTVDIDTSIELDATKIDSTKKPFTKETRYDAQYALLKDL